VRGAAPRTGCLAHGEPTRDGTQDWIAFHPADAQSAGDINTKIVRDLSVG
jgi:hypothetical protein